MILPQTAEYALRAMAHLTVSEGGKPIPACDLSEETGIPVHYLSKILRRLVSAKLLIAQKGPGGGFVLARAVGKIRFVDILEAVDYASDQHRCAFGWGECDPANKCPLHDSWKKLKDDFYSWANKTTLLHVKRGGVPLDQLRRVRGKK